MNVTEKYPSNVNSSGTVGLFGPTCSTKCGLLRTTHAVQYAGSKPHSVHRIRAIAVGDCTISLRTSSRLANQRGMLVPARWQSVLCVPISVSRSDECCVSVHAFQRSCTTQASHRFVGLIVLPSVLTPT